MQKIIRNRIKCLKCGTIIESKSRHHFIWCPCGSCAVDGGTSYLKRAWRPNAGGPEDVYEEMSVVEVDMDSVEKTMSGVERTKQEAIDLWRSKTLHERR